MKKKKFGKPLCRLITMVAICMLSLNTMAYDFSYTYQGKTLHYNITSSNTVAVTSYDDYYHYDYVSGDVVIPSSVTNNGTTYSVDSIGYYAFYGCSRLTSVSIPSSVTSIGEDAFYNCSSLTSVTIPNSVTSIGNGAFYGCSSLTSITIPNSVTSIGNTAFAYCSSLTSLTLPNNSTINSTAFMYAGAKTTIDSVTYCSDTLTVGNYTLVCTGFLTFYLNGNAYFPNNNAQVYNCDESKSGDLIIPSTISYNGTTYSVTSIGEYAFMDCSNLTSVTIPNSVTSIGNYAFYECSNLTSVTIPNSVTYIGNYAFKYCISLTSVTIPNSVTYIGNYAFSVCNLTSVTIPNSVTYIGNYAFSICSNLTSVTIGNSVTSIGGNAFWSCRNLTTLNFSAVNCNDFTSEEYQFSSCPITIINIGDSVQRIPANFANGRSRLTSITIPNSVTSIGSEAFRGCSSLTSVTIPNSVTSIGNSAFCSCSNLTSVNIPDSVTSIKDSTFLGCSSLTSVTIPYSVTSIGNRAFMGCSSLTSVTIPESVTSIGNRAFSSCSSLTTLNFNAINCSNFTYYTYDNECATFASSPITTINLGDSVQRIPANFANGKSGLISISIPNSVTEIGDSAFMNCSGLIAANIGNGVSSIGNAFRGCTNLTYLTIGSGVEAIEDLAFIDCNMLSHITSKATTPPEIASSNVFPYPNECNVTVPCGSLGAYTDQMNRWYLLFNPRIDEDIVFAFSVSANDDAFGIVSNEALSCSVRKITAIPFDGYEFVSWNDGNTSNPRTINNVSSMKYNSLKIW